MVLSNHEDKGNVGDLSRTSIFSEKNLAPYGEVPKWLKGPVLKTGRSCKRRLGSNPSFSAIYIFFGEVAKWLNAADCNSVPFQVRRSESVPLHQMSVRGSHSQELACVYIFLFFLLVSLPLKGTYPISEHVLSMLPFLSEKKAGLNRPAFQMPLQNSDQPS